MERSSTLPGTGIRKNAHNTAPNSTLADRFPDELEALEQRLESSVAGGVDLDVSEPCVWYCACFLVHGP